MERNVKVLPSEILMEQLLSLLDSTDQVPLLISGSSMTPFLVHGRDTVFLSKITQPLKRGDIILYRRDNGAYVVHRICKITEDSFWLIGDAQTEIEKGLRQDQILAIVTAVSRKGKRLDSQSFWWRFFQKVWIHLIPLRPLLMKLASHAKGHK